MCSSGLIEPTASALAQDHEVEVVELPEENQVFVNRVGCYTWLLRWRKHIFCQQSGPFQIASKWQNLGLWDTRQTKNRVVSSSRAAFTLDETAGAGVDRTRAEGRDMTECKESNRRRWRCVLIYLSSSDNTYSALITFCAYSLTYVSA